MTVGIAFDINQRIQVVSVFIVFICVFRKSMECSCQFKVRIFLELLRVNMEYPPIARGVRGKPLNYRSKMVSSIGYFKI